MSVLYTFGYAAPDAALRLDQMMEADPALVLLDIRLHPWSQRYPAFRKAALAQCFGARYQHVPALGNLNHRDHRLPIALVDPVAGVAHVCRLLDAGLPVCLLCACAHVESCHRFVVAHLVQEQGGYQVVHL